MTSYKHRCMFIVPQNLRDDANEQLENMGYGPDFCSVPLKRPGAGPVTHYLCDVACDDTLVADLRSIPSVVERNTGPLGQPGRVSASLGGQNLERNLRVR